MKDQTCPGYTKNTEIEREAIGTAYGETLYKETVIVLSEHCAAFNKTDDFDCTNCPFRQKEDKENA